MTNIFIALYSPQVCILRRRGCLLLLNGLSLAESCGAYKLQVVFGN